jgi:micrococcal nuclease
MYTYKATIVDVYDGDTVTAVVDLGFRINFTIKIRLAGINTPEIRGVERPQGLISKQRLEELILNKKVILHTQKDRQEKFGRWLGVIYLLNSNVSINEQLLKENLADPY